MFTQTLNGARLTIKECLEYIMQKVRMYAEHNRIDEFTNTHFRRIICSHDSWQLQSENTSFRSLIEHHIT